MTSLRRYVRDLRRSPPIDWDVAEQVVMMIEAGTPVSRIGDIAGMPPYWVVHSWRKESQEFDELITVASEAKAERIMDEVIGIADDVARSPSCREVSIRARVLLAKVYNRRKYDPATRVEVTDARVVGDSMTTAELEALVREERRQRLQAEALDVTPETPALPGPGALSGEPPS